MIHFCNSVNEMITLKILVLKKRKRHVYLQITVQVLHQSLIPSDQIQKSVGEYKKSFKEVKIWRGTSRLNGHDVFPNTVISSLPQTKHNTLLLSFLLTLLYCDRNLKNIGNDGFVPECPLYRTREHSVSLGNEDS